MNRSVISQRRVSERNSGRATITDFNRPPAISIKERLGSAYARCFGSPRYRRMNNLLHYLTLRGLGFQNWRDHVISGEETFLRALLARAPEFPVVLDVGAYHGEYAKLVRRYSPSATIYCFEPHPRSFEILRKTAEDDGFEALPLACGAHSGDGHLLDFAFQDGSKRASCYQDTLQVGRVVPLSVHDTKIVTLDEFARTRRIEQIELLKVDVEGAELDVLRGARELISQRRIRTIQFEISYVNAVQRNWVRDFYDLLIGYSFYRLLPHGLLPLGPYLPQTHELFWFQNLVALLDAPLRT
jgi:FkbM family methyltransferase